VNHYILGDVVTCSDPGTNYNVWIGDGCPDPAFFVAGCFHPDTLTINAGDSVTFIVGDDIMPTGTHNVVADDGSFRCAKGCDGEGGDGTPDINWRFTRTFASPGIVKYHDEVSHASGTIVVQGAPASPPTFQITQLFSNLDGTLQFIQLTETAGLNGQHHFAGLTLTSTHDGITKTFTFPNDLPTDQTAHMTVVAAVASDYGSGPEILLSLFRPGSRQVVAYYPEFVLPPRFLATDGGAINFAGADQMTYASLPTDGIMGLYRSAGVGPATLPACAPSPPSCPYSLPLTPAPVTAIEYYNAARDHYFVSASAPDIDALDSGVITGWQRTGESFSVGPARVSHIGIEWQYVGQPVCRIYIPPDSHFYSASADECAQVQRYPGFVLESNAVFYAALPDLTTGECGVLPGIVDGDFPLRPVYRLWNRRTDTNHRFTTSLQVRAEMIGRGWVSEGYGPMGVVMCAE